MRSNLVAPRLRRRAHYLLPAAILFGAGSGTADACVFTNAPFIGSATEKAAWEKRVALDRIVAARERQREYRNRVLTGKIDSADGLAELLIPNVREWYADRSDCGPGGDGDGPPMSKEHMIAGVFAGTELGGLNGAFLSDIVSASFLRSQPDAYNHSCNAEFRGRFADRLRIAVPRRELANAYLLLSNKGERHDRYYRFADAKRITSPRAKTSSLKMAGLPSNSQRMVLRALDGFWIDAVPQLGSPALTCPKAHRQLVADREGELQRLRKKAGYLRYVERAARERE